MRHRLLALLSGGTAGTVAKSLRGMIATHGLDAKAATPVIKCANYLVKNTRLLHYDRALADGLPIATGVIEGACRYLVKDRMGRTGARWSLNSMAAEIWKLCDGTRSGEELAGALAGASGRSLRAVRAEITAFCDALASAGLLLAAPGVGMPLSVAARVSGSLNVAPSFRPLGLASGPRRRPGPRGNSGPG